MKDDRHLWDVLIASSSYGEPLVSVYDEKTCRTARSANCHFSEILSTVCKKAVIIMLTELFALLCTSPHKHSRWHYPSPHSQMTLKENQPGSKSSSLLCLYTLPLELYLIALFPNNGLLLACSYHPMHLVSQFANTQTYTHTQKKAHRKKDTL